MTTRTAIVVGGGIGGLATARALLRQGWTVTVLEQASAFGAVGAGIVLAPNAVRAMEWLGLGEQLRARSTAHGAAGIRAASGRWLLRTRVEDLQRRFGAPASALHRADLHQLLLDACTGATLRTGHQVTSVSHGQDAATVRFDGPDGPSTATAEIVVAADGVHSRSRATLFPDHPGPTYAGYRTWRGLLPGQAATAITETWGRGRRFGIAPLADGQVYWYATASQPSGSPAEDGLADLAAAYRGWHAPIPQVLAATPPQALLRHDIYHLQTPLHRFVAGRVALLGDAAHALTPDLGQGACLALEDAVTLAVAIGGQADVAAALAAYDQARRPRTQRLVRASWTAGRIAQWRNPLAAGLRDTLARLLPPGAYLRSMTDTLGWTPPVEVVDR